MSRAYYNDNDAYCCKWLRNLIEAGLLPAGDVDERDIREVSAKDLKGYTQAHFFAGIGGWPLALRLAGWPDDRPVWTGSCPCQPFSAAGKRQAEKDKRHLWPEFRRLIAECAPPIVFGEQVASKLGRAWLAAVRSDLEALGYAVGAADLCAAGVGAPHIRQRLWFVADAVPTGRTERRPWTGDGSASRCGGDVADASYANGRTGERRAEKGVGPDAERRRRFASGGADELGNASVPGLPAREHKKLPSQVEQQEGRAAKQSGSSFWSDLVWLQCTDGKKRPTQPGLFPLAHGVSGRVAVECPERRGDAEVQETRWVSRAKALKGSGNAIVPQVAAAFISAAMEAVA